MNFNFKKIFLAVFIINSFSLYAQSVTYKDVAPFLGIGYPIQNYYGSVSFVDFDGDGKDDLSFGSRDGFPLYIFKNNLNSFPNVTGSLGLNDQNRTMQLLWVDYDNDGDKDILVTIDDENTYNRFFRNDGPAGFTEVTIEAGLGTTPSSTHSACWGDYNNDGFLDVYITHYSEYTRNYLFKNNGDGTFTDVTIEAGVADSADTPGLFKLPFVAVFLDYDNDGWQDIYIANDHFTGNTLFRNNGNGTFSNVSESSGAGVGGFMMGLAVGDYNNNGFLDIYSSNDPFGNALLKNNGDGTFTDVAIELGVAVYRSCWGTNFFDYDNDGELDLFVAIEAGQPDRTNVLYRNNGDGTFSVAGDIGLFHNEVSFGTAIGDFNNDGCYDIVVNNSSAAPNLYRCLGNSNNWIKIDLTGVLANRDAIGSRIEAYFDGKKRIRETNAGISYASQNSNQTIIGLGQAQIIDSLIIRWPGSGTIDILYNVDVNQNLSITEGETITGVKEFSPMPSLFNLEQNYPNPFNPVTKIKWNSPVTGLQSLKVYDVLGNEVAVLIDEIKPAGTHTIEFDANGLPSGIYFYRLQSGDYAETKKMILMK